MPLNISPATFTGLGVLVGYLLINELSPVEQAAVGSWLNLVGDMLATNSGWIDVIQSQIDVQKEPEDNNQSEDSKSDNENNTPQQDTDLIYKAISKMKKDIEVLQQNMQGQDDM